MRRFLCPDCGNQIHFNNSKCVTCSSSLGYLPSTDQLLVIPDERAPRAPGQPVYAPCENRDLIGCNWLCEPANKSKRCQSCSHTVRIPNISDPLKKLQWSRLERAKRRLIYAIIRFDLPLANEVVLGEGTLRFELLGDELHPDGKTKRVMTGHDNGLITINIAEADDAIREKNRTAMGEPYRTLVGHFRHEVGHYYWDQLVDREGVIDRFRECFGDERRDYSDALKTYYADGPPTNWQNSYVSTYASAHPWEDFAETWAHYFHMVGGLETAYAYGLNPQPLQVGAPQLIQLVDPYHVSDYEQLMTHWIPITVAMNAMNRSIGNSDFYPFALSQNVSEKLKFVHDLIGDQ